jgi:hypothetical protein
LNPAEVYNYTTIHGEPITFGVQQIDSPDESIFLNYMQCTNLYELNYADQKVSLSMAAGSIKIEKTQTSSKVKLNLNTISNSTGEIKVTYGYYPSRQLGGYLGLDSDKIYYNNSIGIGIENPQANLHVNGSILQTGSGITNLKSTNIKDLKTRRKEFTFFDIYLLFLFLLKILINDSVLS